MDTNILEATLKAQLSEAHDRLDQAAGIAKAAAACAEAGNTEKAIEVAFDIDQLIYEVTALLNSASLMNRIFRD